MVGKMEFYSHIYILSLQLIPKATEGCVVFFSANLSPILYQANPYSQPSCKLDKRVEKPPDSHGHIQWGQLLLCWPVSAETHGASDGTADTKGPRGVQVSKHGWVPQEGDAVDSSCWA